MCVRARDRVCLDEGLYVLQVAAAPNGVKVNFDACDVKLSDGKAQCVEIKDSACQLSDVCEDIDGFNAAATTWGGLGLVTCMVALAAGWLLL